MHYDKLTIRKRPFWTAVTNCKFAFFDDGIFKLLRCFYFLFLPSCSYNNYVSSFSSFVPGQFSDRSSMLAVILSCLHVLIHLAHHYFHTYCPSVTTLQNLAEQTKFLLEIMFATSVIVGWSSGSLMTPVLLPSPILNDRHFDIHVSLKNIR